MAFDPETTSYTVAVADTMESGMPSASIVLSVGENEIVVVVTAEDGTTRTTYLVTVRRGAKVLGLTRRRLSTRWGRRCWVGTILESIRRKKGATDKRTKKQLYRTAILITTVLLLSLTGCAQATVTKPAADPLQVADVAYAKRW